MSAEAVAVMPIEGKRTEPIYFWSAVGVFFLLLQLYVFGSWILSEDFAPVNPGPDTMPGYTAFLAIFFQVLNVALAIGVITWAVRSCRREGRVTVALLFVFAWLATFWVDPLANYFRLVYTYNSHMVNFGSWANFIPGWVMPNGHLIAEPLLFNIGAYLSIVPLLCFFMPGPCARPRRAGRTSVRLA